MKERHASDIWDRAERDNNLAMLRPVEISNEEREAIISSIIASQALEGIDVPREMMEAIFEQALREPLPKIGQ